MASRIAYFEGPALLFVGATDEWHAAWARRNAGDPPPEPGMPYEEMYPGRWHDVLELARVAQRDRVVTECALSDLDGDLGILRFIPVGDRRVAAHWTPNGAPAGASWAEGASPVPTPRRRRRAA